MCKRIPIPKLAKQTILPMRAFFLPYKNALHDGIGLRDETFLHDEAVLHDEVDLREENALLNEHALLDGFALRDVENWFCHLFCF